MNSIFTRILWIVITFYAATVPVKADVTVYVPLGSANRILVIDGDKDEITGSISGVQRVQGLAVGAGGNFLVAASMQANRPDSPAAWVQSDGAAPEDPSALHEINVPVNKVYTSKISIIDIKPFADISERYTLHGIAVESRTHTSAVTVDGRYALATHPLLDSISVIDLNNDKLLKTVPTGPQPDYITVPEYGHYVYVSNSGSNTISEIDTETWTLNRNLNTGPGPEHLLLSLDEQMLYTNNMGDGTVREISLADGKTTRVFNTGEGPHGIDLSDDGNILFVSGRDENTLSAIDLSTGEITSRALGPAPYHVTTVTGTGKVYVTSTDDPVIWVIDQNTLELRGTITIPGEGYQMVTIWN